MNDDELTTIALTNTQMYLAGQAGVMRQVENIYLQRKSHFKDDVTQWQSHIEGCLGEYALSQFLNVWWPGKGQLGAADCGDYDARTSAHSGGHLIIYKKDIEEKPMKRFYLLTGENGTYRVRGWFRPIDAEQRQWWKEGKYDRPGFWVPQEELRDPWS